ncbi:hypothetical protein GL50803_007188 [Giardia duodenalis]|uniref:Uncharacterized protein n=1 Tax=Giardia intestinalis (strain ATCC 50803 / WB clone C6) TaxID=184922 RepID=A8BRP6_GIAIC|nr:hypothetical protein GL50803_007188 [Giardia intestinalis]KAE8305965.1 hypothetical protein GL50803_007188 [Giardia intestinalis]|eukprot:XP_001705320.1 Hypothetical protein GL50803_7188 [Giardia lamblia ATCC 50803]
MWVRALAAILATTLGACIPKADIVSLSTESDLAQIRACPCCDFKMEQNITVPRTHIPIKEFSGSLDGNGNSLLISSLEIGESYEDFGFFATIRRGQVFNLSIVLENQITLPGSIRSFGFLAGDAVDPYLYNVALLSDSSGSAKITINSLQANSDGQPMFVGGLIGSVLLEAHTFENVFSKANLTVYSRSSAPLTVGSIFGSVGGSQRVSSIRVDSLSGLNVSAHNTKTLIVGGAIGSAEGSRMVSTSAALGLGLRVDIGTATSAMVGGFVGVAAQLKNVNTSWDSVNCYGTDGADSASNCIVGGIVGMLRSTADDTRVSGNLATHSIGTVGCYYASICYAGGLAGWMENSDLNEGSTSMNVSVHSVQMCHVGGAVGYTNGGIFTAVSAAAYSVSANSNKTIIDSAAVYLTVVGGAIGSVERKALSEYFELYRVYARVSTLSAEGKGAIVSGGLAGRVVSFAVYVNDMTYESDVDSGGSIIRCGSTIDNYSVSVPSTGGAEPLLDLYLSVGGLIGDLKLGRVSSCHHYSTNFIVNARNNGGYTGGIVGLCLSAHIDSSLANIGTMKVSSDEAQSLLYSFVGGAVGSLTNHSSLKESYANVNSTTVSSSSGISYGGIAGSIRNSTATTSFAIIKAVSLTRKAASTKRLSYVGGFAGSCRMGAEVVASWTRAKITLVDEVTDSSAKPLLVGGFTASTGDTYIGQSYSETELILNKENKNCGRFAGYLYSNTNFSYNLALTKISLSTEATPAYVPRGFCGNASQYYLKKGTKQDNKMRILGCIAYKTDGETPDDSPLPSTSTEDVIPTNTNYTNGVSYHTETDLKTNTPYAKWTNVIQTTAKPNRYNVTANLLPVLTQLPTLSASRTLFTSTYTLSIPVCTYTYGCWTNGSECLWKNKLDNAYNTLPVPKRTVNECLGLSACKSSFPGIVTCSRGVPVSKDFLCIKCGADKDCVTFDSSDPSTCDTTENTCKCGLGTAGLTCAIPFCRGPSQKCNDPKIGTCTAVSGISRCVCAQGFYSLDNQCVERHSNWNRVPYNSNDSLRRSGDISVAPTITLLILLLIVGALVIYFGLASCGKVHLPCQSKSAMAASGSYLRVSDSTRTISAL